MSNREVMQQALEALESGLAFDAHSTVLQNLRTALAQPAQEPVGWEHHEYRPYGGPGQIRIHAVLASQYMMPDGSVAPDFQWLVDQYRADKNTIKLIPLYAAPPAAQPEQVDCPRCGHVCSQRPWQGLTEGEVRTIWENSIGWGDPSHDERDFAEVIEAKLKERNT